MLNSLVQVDARGKTELSNQTCNIILSFGCQPALGVLANSKYIKDFINLITSNFDESGSVLLPDLFSRIVSSDAPFELVSCNLARKVRLFREDTEVGQKRLFYAIDSADNTRVLARKTTVDFFVEKLGFEESEIEFVDRTKFFSIDKDGVDLTVFTDEELKILNDSSRRMFGDKKHGLGKQVLHIAICET